MQWKANMLLNTLSDATHAFNSTGCASQSGLISALPFSFIVVWTAQRHVTSPVSFNRSPTPPRAHVCARHRHRRCMFHARCTRPLATVCSLSSRESLEKATAGDHVTDVIAHVQARIEDRTVLPSYGDVHYQPSQHWLLRDTYSGPEVSVKTCVMLKFMDDDDDDWRTVLNNDNSTRNQLTQATTEREISD